MTTSPMMPPKFNEVPFKMLTLPQHLYGRILAEYEVMEFPKIEQLPIYDSGYGASTVHGISGKGLDVPKLGYSPMSHELTEVCYDVITPLIEDWCGTKLSRSWGYGIRSYGRDSVLHLHRDRCDTHVISCIIHVDEEIDEPWPLDFIDHEGIHHKVIFKPGEILFYESLCPHARLSPFNGAYYRNMYFHWRPTVWNAALLQEMKSTFVSVEECLSYYPKNMGS